MMFESMKTLTKFLPFGIEVTTKLISFTTAIVLISILTTSQIGEYTYARSFVLVVSTLLLFGLQASSFKFANTTSTVKTEYLTFSICFTFVVGFLAFLFLYFLGPRIFSKFEYPLSDWIQYLILPNMLILFLVAYFKAVGKPIRGFSISLLLAFLLIAIILVVHSTTTVNIEFALDAVLVSSFIAACISLYFTVGSARWTRQGFENWHIREWFSVSFTMWLSGFLPLFLLQGFILFFGLFFDSEMLGALAIAGVVAANLATFKDISISLFLPRLISHYNLHREVSLSMLLRCIFVGLIPIVMFLGLCLSLEDELLARFPSKLSMQFFHYLYILTATQMLMAIYQPIWRLLSSIGFHNMVLKISIALMMCLFSLYTAFGVSQQPMMMMASSAIISMSCLIVGVVVLQKKIEFKK